MHKKVCYKKKTSISSLKTAQIENKKNHSEKKNLC